MEFTSTPFGQTTAWVLHLPTTCVVSVPKDSHITLVLSSFILRPLSFRHSFHFLNFSFSSSSHFPTSTRSSAYSISHGRPSLTVCVTASIIITPNHSLTHPPYDVILVLACLYMAITTLTNHSSTPSFLMTHSTTFLGTLSKAFSRSTKTHHSSLFFSISLL